jgi:hypothetical protein
MPDLKLYAAYSRQDVHDIFAPDTRFTPSTGLWGLQGIVEIPGKPGDFVFFVTFGQHQAGHTFDEWITEDGVISWQSQPRQSIAERRIQQFIHHDENAHAIFLFLRTRRTSNYTYLGELKYLTHDPNREQPVYMYWQLLDWPIPDEVLERINLRIHPASIFQSGKFQVMDRPDEYDQGNPIFEWRGMRWDVNQQALLAQIGDWIARGLPEEAIRYKDWFIEINGHRLSHKWLFHLITGRVYNEIDAHLAREELDKVGFKAIRVTAQEGADSIDMTNIASANLSRKRSDQRRMLFENIAKRLSDEFPGQMGLVNFRFPERENWFEVHFPKLRGYYILRLAKQFDEFAYFFAGNTKLAETFIQQITPYLTTFSGQMNFPVTVTPRFTKNWGRLGFELPPGWVGEAEEKNGLDIAYADQLGRFIQATYQVLINIQTQIADFKPVEKRDLNSIQPQIKHLAMRLESLHNVLNGTINVPSDEVLCDWVHFCYDFGLYTEGQVLFTLVTSEQVNPWYYERTKKLARLCSIKASARE